MDQNKHVDNNIINYSDGNNYFNYETQSQNNKSEIEKINPHYNIDNICLKNNIDSMDKYVKEKYNIIDVIKKNLIFVYFYLILYVAEEIIKK